MRRIFVFLLSFSFTLAGCSVNPVTGKNTFVLPNLDEDWERDVGEQMYSPLRQSQGGDYVLDPQLTAYVESVGNRLAAQAKRKLPYEFHVLNNSVPNAWALPGGKIVVNRGLLTELNSEAELAAVLGHEIVHADAAHGARQQSKGMLTQVGMMVAMIYGASKAETEAGQQIAMIVPQLGAQLITTKYGRDAERESDRYGMRYMSAAGYNPQGAVELQETFVKLSEGRRSDWLSGLFASHPPSAERVANNRATAKKLPNTGELGREIYLEKTAYLRKVEPAYKTHEEAHQALEAEDTAKARKLLSEAITLEPREALFHARLGDVFAIEKKFKQAERAYSAALQRDDNFFYYHLRRGQTRYEQKKFDLARVDLERSLELLPTAQANYLLGNLDKRAGNLESAIKHYQVAAQSAPPVSDKAKRELVLLELPSNPGKYVQTKAVLGQNGTVGAAVLNSSQLAVDSITLKLEYIDSSGQLRQGSMNVPGTLASGEQTVVATQIQGIANTNELSRRVRVTVTGAKVADSDL